MASGSILSTLIAATQGSLSVILVLAYGYLSRKHGLINQVAEENISKLGTTLLLPALLFSEIGPLANPKNLLSYWPIVPLSLFFQLLSLTFALTLSGLNIIPRHFVGAFVFNNVTSLPLLLLSSLGSTSALDSLGKGEEVLKRGEVYFLINALVGNLCRFGIGPYLMESHDGPSITRWDYTESPFVPHKLAEAAAASSYLPDPHPPRGTSPTPSHVTSVASSEHEPLLGRKSESMGQRVKGTFGRIGEWLKRAVNPPLQGGIAAVCFGATPGVRTVVYEKGLGGWFDPITQSITKIGGLYSALQMFILGAHLYSKPSTSVKYRTLALLFSWRFFIMPAISISTVYFIRTTFPTLMSDDKMLDFVLSLAPVGPPALTLAAIASMSDIDEQAEGGIARIILLSYAVTPLIAGSVSASLWAVGKSGVGQ